MPAVSGKLAEPRLKSMSDVAATLILTVLQEASVKMLPQNVPGKESYSSWVVKAQQIKPPHTKTRRILPESNKWTVQGHRQPGKTPQRQRISGTGRLVLLCLHSC